MYLHGRESSCIALPRARREPIASTWRPHNMCHRLQTAVNGLLKAGVNMNAIFSLLSVGLMKISCSRFKQSKNPLLVS